MFRAIRKYLEQRFWHHVSTAADPAYRGLHDDYETLVRLARRCAYDLKHVVAHLPKNSFYLTQMDMEERAGRWAMLFSKGNPGKDYRMEIQRDLSRYENLIEALRKHYAINPDEAAPDVLKPFLVELPF